MWIYIDLNRIFGGIASCLFNKLDLCYRPSECSRIDKNVQYILLVFYID